MGAATSRAHARTTGLAPHRVNRVARNPPVTAVTLEQGQRLPIDEVRRHLSQVDGPDRPIAIDKDAGGKPEGDPVRVGDLAVRIERYGELRPYLPEKALHRRLVALAKVHRDDLQPSAAVAIPDLLDGWHFVLTGGAPGGPKVDQDHFAANALSRTVPPSNNRV